MKNNEEESYDGQNVIGKYVYNVLMRETLDILSSGASTSALEYDCGRRTEVIVVRSLLLFGCLGWKL